MASLGLLIPSEELDVGEEVYETTSFDDMASVDRNMAIAFTQPRHVELGSSVDSDASSMSNTLVLMDELDDVSSWRLRERMKTVSVALVLCLNVGVDPPDVVKTQPCAKTECWVDPTTLTPQRAIEAIGANLQRHYERWQPRARYRQSLDPPLEEVRRLATSLRRSARDERVLFHYNGHGVPRPTANGEIWVFNRNYTQYIPLSLYDLQSWMGSPSIFVYDCSNAGIIVQSFEQFAARHEQEHINHVNAKGLSSAESPAPISVRNCIQLGACSATELLPMNPELPADLFTCCLTTPIKMALRFFYMKTKASRFLGSPTSQVSLEMLDRIPGQFSDRRTMLGELNWIFTAITDTIAWNTLPRELFQKLFRQDLLVASLFRNFLLAERIMRSYDCSPVSQPKLPSNLHQHPIWMAWDYAVDLALLQLPDILRSNGAVAYRSSSFFEDQLTAFEVWLKNATTGGRDGRKGARGTPEQLPIVLQVLLSQVHRVRALDLLARFLDLGPWAVFLALSVGIFPYILKLLQSAARELRPLLVSIWAKILAVDSSCQAELLRDSGQRYFISVLQEEVNETGLLKPVHHTQAAYVLAVLLSNYKTSQWEVDKSNLIPVCLEHLGERDSDPRLHQWLAIALGRSWYKNEAARWRGARDNAHEKLYALLESNEPEVRSAAIFALGSFIDSCVDRTEHANTQDHAITLHLLNSVGHNEASAIVRRELVLALFGVVVAFEANFLVVARAHMSDQERVQQEQAEERLQQEQGLEVGLNRRILSRDVLVASPNHPRSNLPPSASIPAQLDSALRSSTTTSPLSRTSTSSLSVRSIYLRVWSHLNALVLDPCPQVMNMATEILLYLRLKARAKEAKSGTRSAIFQLGSSNLSSGSSSMSIRSGRIHVDRPNSSMSSLSSSEDNTLTGMEEPPLPSLTTDFIAWASKRFIRDLSTEDDNRNVDRMSKAYMMQDWLFNRNIEVRSRAEKERKLLAFGATSRRVTPNSGALPTVCRLDEQWGLFKTNIPKPSVVLLHPFNTQMAVAGGNLIKVYKLQTPTSSSTSPSTSGLFYTRRSMSSPMLTDVNTEPWCTIKSGERTRFTDIAYINAHEKALLVAGSDDGCIRVYGDEEHEDNSFKGIRQLSAWCALSELRRPSWPSNGSKEAKFGSKMLLAWEQSRTLLAVGAKSGNRVVRLWDARAERHKSDLIHSLGSKSNLASPMSTLSSSVTSLNFSHSDPNVVVVGFGDGSIALFDIRAHQSTGTKTSNINPCFKNNLQSSSSSQSSTSSAVLDCQMQGLGGFSESIISGHVDGHLRLLDPRKPSQVVLEVALSPQKLTLMRIHPRAKMLTLCNSLKQVSVHVLDIENQSLVANTLNPIKHQQESSLLSSKPVSKQCLAVHPHLIQVATASADGAVSLFNLRKTV